VGKRSKQANRSVKIGFRVRVKVSDSCRYSPWRHMGRQQPLGQCIRQLHPNAAIRATLF